MDFLPFDTIGGILAIILGFGFIIFVHELGHFLVAKWVGIKCPQFAIGMGTAAVSFRKGMGWKWGSTEAAYEKLVYDYVKKQGELPPAAEGQEIRFTPEQYDRANAALGLSETEYRLNWLPLGGYVKMLGQEDMDPNARSTDPRAFNSKPIWARACVISAGVVMNIIFGVIFFVIAFMAGVGFNPSIVGDVEPGMPAAKTYAAGHDNDPAYYGLKLSDHVTHVNDIPTRDLTDVRIAGALAGHEEVFKLTVEREVEGKATTLAFNMMPTTSANGLKSFGFGPVRSITLASDRDIEAENFASSFAAANVDVTKTGVAPGMTLFEAGGKPVKTYRNYVDAVGAGRGKPVPVVFKDLESGKTATVELSGEPVLPISEEVKDEYAPELLGVRPATDIGAISPKSPADKAGLKAGDILKRVGGTDWPSTEEVKKEVKAAERKPVRVVVLRGGEEIEMQVTPEKGLLGIAQGMADKLLRKVDAGSPLSDLNLPGGSRLVSVDGETVDSFQATLLKLAAKADANPDGFDVTIGYEPAVGKEPVVRTKQVRIEGTALAKLKHIDWRPALTSTVFNFDIVILQESSPVAALALGVKKAQQSMLQVYLTLRRLTQGSVPLSQMQGPVGITHTGARIAKQGWTYLIFFLALISVNLAVINFLPLPIVDGGHIVFLIIEKIKGSPVGPKVQTGALFAGLALIAFVFIYVTYNDILRLFA
ncbi:MAG: site-2 protease family protein [Phycisphaeraceae bacterium]